MESEEWRDIKGYEERYQVSSFGRIRSLARLVPMPNGQERRTLEIIMSTRSIVHGHPAVWLSKDGKDKKHFVHRLVAEAFLIPRNIRRGEPQGSQQAQQSCIEPGVGDLFTKHAALL